MAMLVLYLFSLFHFFLFQFHLYYMFLTYMNIRHCKLGRHKMSGKISFRLRPVGRENGGTVLEV